MEYSSGCVANCPRPPPLFLYPVVAPSLFSYEAASAPANLHEAVAAGDLSAVETYIAQGKVDAAESAASTCPSSVLSAMLAVSGVEGAAVAAGCGALEVRDWRGRTPLHVACEHGRTDVVRALLAGGAIANATDRDG